METNATSATVYNDDGSENSKIAMVETRWKAARDLRIKNEREWSLNLAFVSGEQWLTLSRVTNRLEPLQTEPWRVRYTSNLCLAWVRTALGVFTGSKPIWTVIPVSADNDAKMAADLADKSLHGQWHRLKMDLKLQKALLWMLVTGKVFFKVYWDPTLGDDYQETAMAPTLGPDGQPVMLPHPSFAHLMPMTQPTPGEPLGMAPHSTGAEQGGMAGPGPGNDAGSGEPTPPFEIPMTPHMSEQPTGRILKTGDIAVDVVSSYELFPDPGATEIDECRWVIHCKVESVDVLKQTYGEAAHDLKPESLDADDPMRRKLMTGYSGNGNRSAVPVELMNRAIVKEYWEKPSPEYPQGRHIVVANGKLLLDGVVPEGYDPIPFYQLEEIQVADQFWAQSTVTHIRPINKLYNKIRSQVTEIMNLMSKPKWLVHKGSQIGDQSINNEPGEVIEFVSVNGHVPTMISAPPLPQYIEAHLDRTMQDYQEVSGAHESTRGVVPGDRSSGRLASMLQQADESRFGPVAMRVEKALEGVASAVLKLQHQYYDENRNLHIVGKDRIAEVIAFKGEDLKGTYRVEIQAGTSIPMSKPNQRDYITTLVQQQMLSPQQGLKMLDMPTLDTLQEDTWLSQAYAREENEKMAAGQPSQPQPWEDSKVHMDEHERFMQSARFRSLDPQTQMLIQQHWLQTLHMVGMRDYLISSSTVPQPMPGMGEPGVDGPPGQPNAPQPPGTSEQAAGMPPVPPTPTFDPHGS